MQSLLNSGFNEEIPAPIEDAAYTWRATDDSLTPTLRPIDAGLATAGAMPALTEMSQIVEASTQQVIGFLAEEGCNATIVEEAEVRIMLEDGFANGRSAGQVARDIITWLVEDEERAEEAQEATNAGATDADTADDGAVASEVAAVADALDAAPTARTRANLRVAAQAVVRVRIDDAEADAHDNREEISAKPATAGMAWPWTRWQADGPFSSHPLIDR